jgi:Type IV secretion-system coupling protein DNA-binding domain
MLAAEDDGELPDTLTVPLYEILPDVTKCVTELSAAFNSPDLEELDLFTPLRQRLAENLKLINPKIVAGLPSREIIRAYLNDTQIEPFFDRPMPFQIPDSSMMEHCVIVAGAGTGKTQTLGSLIGRYLERDDPPAMVIVDSTGALVKKIQTLALFNERLKERIVIIDPEHSPLPALNMFDISNPLRIPTQSGHRFRFEAGHRSDLMPATIPK